MRKEAFIRVFWCCRNDIAVHAQERQAHMGKYKFNFKRIWDKLRSAYQVREGLGSVQMAIETAVQEGLLDDPYADYRNMSIDDIEEAELHASPGTALQKQGGHVLEFDMAGSGFYQFRSMHAGLDGYGRYLPNGENSEPADMEELDLKEEPITWKNRLWPWVRNLFGIASPEEVMARNEQVRERTERARQMAATIREQRGQKARHMAEEAAKTVKPQAASSPAQPSSVPTASAASPAQSVSASRPSSVPVTSTASPVQPVSALVPAQSTSVPAASAVSPAADPAPDYTQLSAKEELIQSRFGQHTSIEGLSDKEYIYERKSNVSRPDGTNVYKTRFTMAGPLENRFGIFGKRGASNTGTYSIQNLSEYMLTAGQKYLENIFREWEEGKNQVRRSKDIPPITIMIRGHSRGGVASAHGAMKLQHWIDKNYPQYAQRVHFKLLQLDPVPGYGSDHGLKKSVYLQEQPKDKDLKNEMEQRRMDVLGPQADTTVIYSMHTDHNHWFTPQEVHGAKRIILTATEHGVDLEKVDTSQLKNGDAKVRREGYFDLATKQMYRGSGIHDLPEGIYIADENNCLTRVPSYKAGERIMDLVTKGKRYQKSRRNRIKSMMAEWFDAHGKELPKQQEAQDHTEASEKRNTRERISLVPENTFRMEQADTKKSASRREAAMEVPKKEASERVPKK